MSTPPPPPAGIPSRGANFHGRLAFAALVWVSAGAATSPAQAVRRVPADHPTIATALQAAAAGDVVEVAAGTWAEAVQIPAGVALSGAGAAVTVIDPPGTPLAAVATASGSNADTLLQGFTVRGAQTGIVVAEAALTVVDCVVAANAGPGPGGGVVVDEGGRAVLVNCVIRENSTGGSGGGVHAGSLAAGLTLVDCVVIANAAAAEGGGIAVAGEVPGLLLLNVVVAGNTAARGGGMILASPFVPARLRGCTFHGNVATLAGGALALDATSELGVENAIVWDNAPAPFDVPAGAVLDVRWSDVQGGVAGPGNIAADPLFANPGSGNFALASASPCRDAGDPAGPRDPDGTRADMGWFAEFPTLPGYATGNARSLSPWFAGLPDALAVNGSNGGPARRIDVAAGQPVTVSFGAVASNPGSTSFAIALLAGTATAADQRAYPWLGGMAFVPCTLDPSLPGRFTLADNLVADPCGALAPSAGTPWSFIVPPGLPAPARLTIQGAFLQEPHPTVSGGPWLRTTNAVLLNVTP